jgi:antitoxin VapB
MGLNIKNDETHRLAAELARLTGESMTSAVTEAIRQRLERERRRRDMHVDRSEIKKIVRRIASRPVLDDRSADEILGYDERGLPNG